MNNRKRTKQGHGNLAFGALGGLLLLPLATPMATRGAAFPTLAMEPTVGVSDPGSTTGGRLEASVVPQAYGDTAFADEFSATGLRSMGEWTSSAQLDARAEVARRTGLGSIFGAVLEPLSYAGALPGASAEPEHSLILEWGLSASVAVQPSLAGQQIPIFLRNTGASLEVGGLDLKIAVEGGSGPYPSFTGVDLRASTFVSADAPFRTSNSVQGADANNTGQLQFWSVSINDPSSPPTLLGGGAVTQIGVVTLSTVGVASGSWSLVFRSEATALTSPFGDELALGFRNADLQAVPEPNEVATVSAALLLGAGWFLRRNLRHREVP